jgi:glycosyltransferase involved in cell wall biosynthesis
MTMQWKNGARPVEPAAGPALTFLVSADYARFTGGYVYNERLLAGLAERGWTIRRIILPAGFPRPDTQAVDAARATVDALPDGTLVLADQICVCPLPEAIEANASRLRFAVIAHHLMAREVGPSAAAFAELERRVMPLADAVVAPSRTTAAELVEACGVDPRRITVAPPGLDPLPLSRGSDGSVPAILAVGAVVPRKGYDALVAGLATIADRPWTLTIVGDLDRAPDYVADLAARIAAAGLDGRIRFAGTVDDVAPLWDGADLFVAAARHEGWGMAVAEAAARGLAVVTASSGAVAEWLDPSVAAIVPDADDPAFAAAVAALVSDAGSRRRMGAAAREFAARLPRWPDTAGRVDRALAPLAAVAPVEGGGRIG